MTSNQVKLKLDKHGRISNNQSIDVIMTLVEDVEKNKISFEEVQKKYGHVKLYTLKKWVEVYGSGSFTTKHRTIAVDTKLQAVYELESGELTLKQVMRKYKVSDNTVKLWQKKYAGSSDKSKPALDEQLQELDERAAQKQIAELKLKIYGLETMIDVAEKQYHIAIRKKFGTKQ